MTPQQITILPVDAHNSYTKTLEPFFEPYPELILLPVTNEQTLMDRLREGAPDYLLFSENLVLRNQAKLLREIRDFAPKTQIIISAERVFSQRFRTTSREPISFIGITGKDKAQLAYQLAQSLQERFPSKEEIVTIAVTKLLREVGVPAHLLGYHYLRAAILLLMEDPDLLSAITKTLYPAVAKQFKTTSARVERAIRHAIELAWERADFHILWKFFGSTVDAEKGRPTNSEFIAMLADYVSLEMAASEQSF